MFEIDERLLRDTFDLGEFQGTYLRLHRNASVLWFIVIPPFEEIELFDIPEPNRSQVRQVVDRVAKFVQAESAVQKVNVAAIGNVVSQLHIHVIGRHQNDPYWPDVVWGRSDSVSEYNDSQVEDLKTRIGAHLI